MTSAACYWLAEWVRAAADWLSLKGHKAALRERKRAPS